MTEDPPDPPGRPGRDDLAALFLGGQPAYSREDVAREVGVPVTFARRMWRALGFADVGGHAAFTAADVTALRRVHHLVADGTLDEETAVQLVRSVGSTAARLAQWQAETVTEVVAARAAERGTSRITGAYELAQRLVPEFEALQAYAWQRHLAASALRLERLGARDSDLLATTLTVGFADLVGYTRLSGRLSPGELGRLVERFEAVAADRVAWHGARLVKTLGDAVLFIAARARDGVDVSLSLVADLSEEEGMPAVRVGVTTGQVLTRFGDVYGEVVNRASRLTALARKGRVAVDAETAVALGAAPGLSLRRRAPRPVRGLGRVDHYEVRVAP